MLTNDPSTGQPVEIDPDEVIRVNSNLVPIPASVIDDLGRAITDLEVKDFELRVDGQPKPIGDLSRAETPVRLALLFDNSYSLRTARELEKQSAMRFFRTVMRPSDQAAIYSVTTEPILEQPLTNDVNRLVHIIERYGEPEGATALLDTIVEAADLDCGDNSQAKGEAIGLDFGLVLAGSVGIRVCVEQGQRDIGEGSQDRREGEDERHEIQRKRDDPKHRDNRDLARDIRRHSEQKARGRKRPRDPSQPAPRGDRPAH